MNANTPKFVAKLKLFTKTHPEEEEDSHPDILKDLDIFSLAESPHLWDEIDPFGIKRYIFIADLWGCSIDEIEKRQIQLQEKHSSSSPDFR